MPVDSNDRSPAPVRVRRRGVGLLVSVGFAAAAASGCTSSTPSASVAEGTTVAATVAAATTSSPPPTTSAPTTSTTPPTTLSPSTVATAPAAPLVKVTGPVTGGKGQATTARGMDPSIPYDEAEYFFEGTAAAYALVGERTADGKWSVIDADSKPYKSRLIVRRPVDPTRFSGTVVVEWLNVSAGGDGDPDWGYLHQELLREGDVWVGVSVQAIGVVGGDALVGGATTGGLAGADPERYGTLTHPGDAFAYDIFTQAASALRNHDGPDPLGGLAPTHIMAIGESQSAFFLTTYIDAIHPRAQVFDGFFVHSRGGGAPDLSGGALRAGDPTPIAIRDDVDVPVFMYETETDLTVLAYAAARQDDGAMVHTWEVAGTAHADSYLLREVYGLGADTDLGALLNCPQEINSGPQHETIQAAFHHFKAWVSDGTAPPTGPRIETAADPSGTNGISIVRDAHGLAVGGIRTPPVDVPLVALSGDAPSGGGAFCFLFGTTTPFDTATRRSLYPDATTYRDKFTASANQAVTSGFLLRADADAMIAKAVTLDPFA